MSKAAVIVPVLNAGKPFGEFLSELKSQTYKPACFIVIDSESTDDTVRQAEAAGAQIISIKRSNFNHGGTRMLGVSQLRDCDVVVFLTQDAILASGTSLEKLIQNFEDERVDVAYGRQLPRKQAGPIETFARHFNYPAKSEGRSKADIPRIGFKTSFCSNSFAAYRISRLLEVGGFPLDTIFGEDALAVAKIILAGGMVRYDADATVYHSHNYTLSEEFKRYFDIGVMHSRFAELLQDFGSASSAGRAFVLGELKFLARTAPHLMPEAIARTAAKYVSYKLGQHESRIPLHIKSRISMTKRYWVPSTQPAGSYSTNDAEH